ncbi:MAG TPA: UDP-N-acetylenolpyruvoylglucosamine reductase [Lachnospiraceae bacterium]|nr:UDP-N-acetylenolpyruvoylglucosamine reductase [Lachnospiraceae bacterium]
MIQLKEGELLSSHTTFRIGGAAKYFAVPKNEEEIMEAVDFAIVKDLPYYILGKGSNVLFADEGYPGVVIEIGAGMEKVERTGDTGIRAQAGVSLSALAVFAAREGLSGLEFAGGIPGTLGGAVTMNAGAYGGEMKDVIVSAKVMDEEGVVQELSCEELQLGYRTSIVQKKQLVVLEAEFLLKPGTTEEIQNTMKELNAKRREKQPLEYPSAGSTFKRPEGYFAGKLIEDAGLRGYRVGDAQVSEKHCGFVVNRGKATCAEVLQLIKDVQKEVKEQFGVQLEPEVRIIR